MFGFQRLRMLSRLVFSVVVCNQYRLSPRGCGLTYVWVEVVMHMNGMFRKGIEVVNRVSISLLTITERFYRRIDCTTLS